MSFDTDAHRQGAAKRDGELTPRGALPARAGQLRRWPPQDSWCSVMEKCMDQHDEEFLRKAAAAKARVSQIEPSEVDAQISAGVVAIDVREPSECEKGTVPGSRNIAIGFLAQTIVSVVPDKSAPVVCFCNGGNRGAMAAAELLDLGYTNVKSIAGGLRAYASQKEAK